MDAVQSTKILKLGFAFKEIVFEINDLAPDCELRKEALELVGLAEELLKNAVLGITNKPETPKEKEDDSVETSEENIEETTTEEETEESEDKEDEYEGF